MTATFDQLLVSARDWAQRAVNAHWLQARDLAELQDLDSGSPGALFEPGAHRPLVAAFFGGTGVGKSSLLNRLAGQTVARTGVERPTSREVSVYLHQSIQIAKLPNDFPLDKVRIAQHPDDQMRQVMWVDMPDIDSVEQHNRELVLEWLPHIDVLIYVVSPERYRDDKGWRLLREHGGDHAWLFVLNQWDRGEDVQFDDFRQLLISGGFADPIVLRTDCREAVAERRPDDFAELQNLLREVSAQHVMSQLETRQAQSRLGDLEQALAGTLARLGQREGYRGLESAWDAIWTSARADLMTGLEWPMRATAATFAGKDANPLSRALDLSPRPNGDEPPKTDPQRVLWDDWADGRVRDAQGQLLVAAGNAGLPVNPLRTVLEPALADTGRQVFGRSQLMLRQALAQPGNGLQRIAMKILGALAVILPLAALGWASYQVVTGYYESADSHLGYLGTDFAIHSVLLIGLSWLLPWFASTRLKPSVEKSALNGLREGVSSALADQGAAIAGQLATADSQRDTIQAEADALLDEIRALTRQSPSTSRMPELLRRMLPTEVKG